MMKIRISRVFGKLLPLKDEKLIKQLADYYEKCYFEKDINEGFWYLTIKNVIVFDLLYYYEKIKTHRGYCSTIVSFSDGHFIQSEFYSKKRNSQNSEFILKRSKVTYKIKNEASNSMKYIIKELIEYIDGTFVIPFFKQKVQYNFTKDKERRIYTISVSNFIETFSLDQFIFLINEWKRLNVDNYSGLFRNPYKFLKDKNKILIQFTGKINTVLKKKD